MARTKSSYLSRHPSKDDDEYEASSSEKEVVPESDSDDSDSVDCSFKYLLKPVVRSCVSSSKQCEDDMIVVPDSKKKKADGGRSRDEEIMKDSSSSKKKKADGGRSKVEETLKDSSSLKKKKKKKSDDEVPVPDSKKTKAADRGRSEGGDFWSKYPNIAASVPSLPAGVMSSLKEKLSGIGNAKAKKLDDKWKQLAVEQIQLDCKMLELMRDQLQLALDK